MAKSDQRSKTKNGMNKTKKTKFKNLIKDIGVELLENDEKNHCDSCHDNILGNGN